MSCSGDHCVSTPSKKYVGGDVCGGELGTLEVSKYMIVVQNVGFGYAYVEGKRSSKT
jgi:hypothetical protein